MVRRFLIPLVSLIACASVVAASGAQGAHADATLPPRVMAIVPSPTGPRLEPLDARTLAPVLGAWSRDVTRMSVTAAVSPLGTRVAVEDESGSLLVLGTATGRLFYKYREVDASTVYWLGGEGSVIGSILVTVGQSSSGPEFAVLGADAAFDYDDYPESVAPLKDGLTFAFDPQYLETLDPINQDEFDLSKLPATGPFQVVGDVLHDRVFVVSSTGLVAEIGPLFDVTRNPRIRYHRVDLNGRPFQAAWAGAGKIALWGEDGLGTIDTRTWKTHALAVEVTHALATRFGIAAWGNDPAQGLTVYRPDGKRLLRVLRGKNVQAARSVGHYLYADADARYSVDLRNGKVTGPLSRKARILTPDLVAIP